MGFLIEAKCSLNCKDKQNISKEIVSLEEHRCHHFFRCLLHLGTSLGCVALYHTTSCPSKPPRNLQMIGLSPSRLESGAEVATFTRDSVWIHRYCLLLFSELTTSSYVLNGRGRKKQPENNPFLIRFTQHNKRLFGHCLDCHFSKNLLFD